MVANSQNRANAIAPERIEQILDAGSLSRRDYFQLVSLFLSDFAVQEEERRLLNRIFDEIQTGRLKLGD